MYLFDIDVLSNLMKRSPSHDLLKRVGSVPVGSRFTSSITLGELVYGAERCTAPEVPELRTSSPRREGADDPASSQRLDEFSIDLFCADEVLVQ